jgi:hypothetical protein
MGVVSMPMTLDRFFVLKAEFRMALARLKQTKDLDEKECLLRTVWDTVRKMDPLFAEFRTADLSDFRTPRRNGKTMRPAKSKQGPGWTQAPSRTL